MTAILSEVDRNLVHKSVIAPASLSRTLSALLSNFTMPILIVPGESGGSEATAEEAFSCEDGAVTAIF